MKDDKKASAISQLLEEYNNLYLYSVDLQAKQDRDAIVAAFDEYMGIMLGKLHPDNRHRIYLVDEESMDFVPVGGNEDDAGVFEREFAAQSEAGLIGWALANRRSAPFVPDVSTGFVSGTVLPLYTPDLTLGFVVGLLKNEAGTISGDVLQILNLITIQTSLLMENQANIAKINEYNRSLQDKVDERTRELSEKNELLTRLAEDLDRKRMDAEIANRTKSRFLSSMSHEIRTPLNVIIGMSDMLYKTKLDSMQEHYIRNVCDCGSLLLGIINDVLDISKIEAGELRLETIDFNLEEVIEKAFSLARQRNSNSRVSLVCDISPDIPCCFSGDPVRIEQVLVNLLVNAVKFTHEGRVGLFVGAAADDGAGKCETMLEMIVSDTGIGIAPDKLDAIFESFVQADLSTTRKFGGSGLGLAICRHLVQAMNGTITVKSEIDKGTEFTVRVPLKASQMVCDEGKKIDILNGDTIAVLGTGDSEIGADMHKLCNRLGAQECMVVSEWSGFFRNLPEKAFDFIFVDTAGLDFEEIRALTSPLRENYKDTFLVALFSQNVPSPETSALFDAFLFRPVLEREFIKVISRLKFRLSEVATAEERKAAVLDGVKVLVAEDIEVNRMVIERQLSGMGCVVDFAFNGKIATEKVFSDDYDCVLMDFHMPEMDGLTATRLIREKGFSRPVIAMTADSLKCDVEEGLSAGMNDVLIKPVSIELLQRTLLKWIKGGEAVAGAVDVSVREEETQSEEDSAEIAVVVDYLGILEAVGSDAELAREICSIFTSEIGGYIESLETALKDGDAENARLAAHAIKNMAGNVCAAGMREQAWAMESACRENDLDKAGGLFAGLVGLTGQVLSCLGSHEW